VSEPPIVCTLSPAALAARREGLLTDLLCRARDYEQRGDGLLLRFAPDDHILTLIARAVEAERQCCRFLRFHITVEPDGGPLALELTGPPGTGEFLAALIRLS
jgi:hypothetical protein